MSFNDEAAPKAAAPDSSPGLLLRFYFYSFVLIAFGHEAYHLSTGESFFWKVGEGTVQLTSMASDHSATLGPIVLLGAVLLASGCCSLLDATGSRPRTTPKLSPIEGGSGQFRAIPQLQRE